MISMQKILINWKTSSTGFLMILGAVISIIYTFSESGRVPNQTELMAQMTAIFGGVGLLLTRDSGVSTEEENGHKELEDLGERLDKNK